MRRFNSGKSTTGLVLAWCVWWLAVAGPVVAGELAGVTVTPHRIEPTLKYRRPHDTSLGARVQLFVRGAAKEPRFDGQTAAHWLEQKEWAWQDITAQPAIPEGALGVWNFNGQDQRWGVGRTFQAEAEGLPKVPISLADPTRWISAVTFLASQGTRPDQVLIHVRNASNQPLALRGLHIWLPKSNSEWHTFWPGGIWIRRRE
jgi:hypothetical protein